MNELNKSIIIFLLELILPQLAFISYVFVHWPLYTYFICHRRPQYTRIFS